MSADGVVGRDAEYWNASAITAGVLSQDLRAGIAIVSPKPPIVLSPCCSAASHKAAIRDFGSDLAWRGDPACPLTGILLRSRRFDGT
jgi:hypothetical protein